MVHGEGVEKSEALPGKHQVSPLWGPEERHELIQLLLRATRHSKDASALGEEGTPGKAAGARGMSNCGGAGGSGSPPTKPAQRPAGSS